MLALVMTLFYRLHWTLRQLTPAHPLLDGLVRYPEPQPPTPNPQPLTPNA